MNYNDSLNLHNSNLREILDTINNLPDAGNGEIDITDATITPDKVFKDEIAYGNEGKVVGTFTIDNEINHQNELLNSILINLDNKSNNFSNYQQVEWLRAEAKVGSYIDLGFQFDTEAVVIMSQWILNDNTAYPFGVTNNSGTLRCMITAPFFYNNTNTIYAYGSNGSNYISAIGDYVLNEENIILVQWKNKYLHYTNELIPQRVWNSSQTIYSIDGNLYLFAQNYKGSPRFGDARQIGKFKYFDKNYNCLCDLIPCYRKSDNEPGMYDRLTGKFFTNIGSGSFIIGPEII